MTKARRDAGSGSISQRPDGRWQASLSNGFALGKRQRRTVYGKTKREVADKLKVLIQQQAQGLSVTTDRQTVAQFLDGWLRDIVAIKNRPQTYDLYRRIVARHLVPTIGTIPLVKLAPQHVQQLLQSKGKDYSPATVSAIHHCLGSALRWAVRWQLVPRNVALLALTPPQQPKVMTVLTPEQARHLLDAARGDRLEALYRVALSLGLRRGEMLGLRWQDVDWDAARLHVVHSMLFLAKQPPVLAPTKTAKSVRDLPLPPSLLLALKEHHARQLHEQLIAGSKWHDQDLVFCTPHGKPLDPRDLWYAFRALQERAGVPPMRLHDLRHSAASLMAAQGVPARTIMAILGHSSIGITYNTYVHVYEEAKDAAGMAMEEILGEVKDGRR